MTVLSGLSLWILLVSVLLLAPPLDNGVIVGDFSPDEYNGKLNPLGDDSIVVDDLYFPSHGETCHAWLYTKPATTSSAEEEEEEEPVVKGLPPVIVMAPGFGTQKDFGLDRYAERFVQAGYAVFMFDYRNFAASTGTPRNWVSPQRHVEDYHSALDYIEKSWTGENDDGRLLLSRKVDASRILLWGTSFSGGHVLEIAAQRASDSYILGVVSQVPHLSGKAAAIKGFQTRGIAKMLRMALAALQDKARHYVGLSPINVKIIGSGHDLAMMSVTPEDHARYMEKQPPKKLGGWINQTPARILLELRFFNPIETLRQLHQEFQLFEEQSQHQAEPQEGEGFWINVPVLLIGASLDDLCPPEIIELASTLILNSKLIIREGTHFQIYEPQNWVYLADEMVNFYKTCVGPRKSRHHGRIH